MPDFEMCGKIPYYICDILTRLLHYACSFSVFFAEMFLWINQHVICFSRSSPRSAHRSPASPYFPRAGSITPNSSFGDREQLSDIDEHNSTPPLDLAANGIVIKPKSLLDVSIVTMGKKRYVSNIY